MPGPSEWARHYRRRADECKRLAKLTESEELRKQFGKTASHYLALTEAEEMSAKGQSHNDSDHAEHPPPLAAK